MTRKITNKVQNFKMTTIPEFVQIAQQLKPQLYQSPATPKYLVTIEKTINDWTVTAKKPVEQLKEIALGKNQKICLDFGDHHVGYISFQISPVGSPPDAPAFIRLKLAETPPEIGEQSEDYNGSISSSWIQEEYLHLDTLPATITLPRRYAFRYLELLVKDTSPKYQIVIDNVVCNCVTSANLSSVKPLTHLSEDLQQLDKVALKTMAGCMHSVFEDGPKRDRRLWIGDLRLQAQTNYLTFQENDLVKRCLYLFGGLQQNQGRVGACLFIEPELLVDDTALFDYSLFFISCLSDYYHATQDFQTLCDLWPIAYHQVELAFERLNKSTGIVDDSDEWWCFLDWHEDLNKQAGAQGVLIYTLRQAIELAELVTEIDSDEHHYLNNVLQLALSGAKHLWDAASGFFVSGKEQQISWASQIWMVLAKVLTKAEHKQLLLRLIEQNPSVGMVTPYLYHHFIEALFQNDMSEEALKYLRYYWGGMIAQGADTFWELYNPKDPHTSPYGSRIINSYCHAWSCGPAYFLRKYL